MRFVLLLLLVPLVLGSAALPVRAASCDELVVAAQDGNVSRMRQLIDGGASKDCRHSQTAETPLMWAATNGKVDAVKLLLELGADANVRDTQGNTALDQVAAREAAFAKLPNFADLASRQRQVMALLEPRTSGPRKTVAPVGVKPADPDMVAKLKMDGARAAMMGGFYDDALRTLTEVVTLRGLPEPRRAAAHALACEIGMRKQSYKFAKNTCEVVLTIPTAAPEDREDAIEKLKILRRYHPELFK